MTESSACTDSSQPAASATAVQALGDVPHNRGEVARLAVEREPPRRDPGDLEQAVDQPREPARLPECALELLIHDSGGSLRSRGHGEHLELEAQGRQRGPELVGGDREEVVARDDRLARGEVEARVLDREARALAEPLRHDDVLRAVAPPREPAYERHGPDDPLASAQWHRDVRARPELAEELGVLGAERAGHPRHVLHVRVEHRLALADHPGNASPRLGLRREPPSQVAERRLLDGVEVGGRRLPDDAVGLGQIDDAPVGEARDDQVGERRERRLVVERLREHGGPCLVEEPLRLLGPGTRALLLDAAALGDVVDGERQSRGLRLPPPRGSRVRSGAWSGVPLPGARTRARGPGTRRPARARRRGPGELGAPPRAMGKLAERLAPRRRRGRPEHAVEGVVRRGDAEPGVQDHDGNRHRLERRRREVAGAARLGERRLQRVDVDERDDRAVDALVRRSGRGGSAGAASARRGPGPRPPSPPCAR